MLNCLTACTEYDTHCHWARDGNGPQHIPLCHGTTHHISPSHLNSSGSIFSLYICYIPKYVGYYLGVCYQLLTKHQFLDSSTTEPGMKNYLVTPPRTPIHTFIYMQKKRSSWLFTKLAFQSEMDNSDTGISSGAILVHDVFLPPVTAPSFRYKPWEDEL